MWIQVVDRSRRGRRRRDRGRGDIRFGSAAAAGGNQNEEREKSEGLKAIQNARARIDNANDYERDLINSLWVLYDKESFPDSQASPSPRASNQPMKVCICCSARISVGAMTATW